MSAYLFLIQSLILFDQYHHAACCPDEHENICDHQKGAVLGVKSSHCMKYREEYHSGKCDTHGNEMQEFFDLFFHVYCVYGDKGKKF